MSRDVVKGHAATKIDPKIDSKIDFISFQNQLEIDPKIDFSQKIDSKIDSKIDFHHKIDYKTDNKIDCKIDNSGGFSVP